MTFCNRAKNNYWPMLNIILFTQLINDRLVKEGVGQSPAQTFTHMDIFPYELWPATAGVDRTDTRRAISSNQRHIGQTPVDC